MESRINTRTGFTQARLNSKTGRLFVVEVLFVAIFIGIYFASWYSFGAALFALTLICYLQITGLILAITFSSLWACLAAANACIFHGVDFFQDSFYDSILILFSTPASCVLGISFFALGLHFHLTGIEWARDVLDPIGRNFPKIPGFKK